MKKNMKTRLFSGLMAEAIQHPDVVSAYLGEANYA